MALHVARRDNRGVARCCFRVIPNIVAILLPSHSGRDMALEVEWQLPPISPQLFEKI
jgi:hypothetical protein